MTGLAAPLSHRTVRAYLPPLLRLGVPVVLAELGWMGMSLVDTVMVSPLGPEAIGAVGLGASLFMAVAVFGMGLLLGLDTLVSHSFGARRLDECHAWLFTGVLVGVMLAIPVTAGVAFIATDLSFLSLHPDVERLAAPYLGVVSWSLLPLLGYAAFRRYLQGMSLVRPITFALLSANIVNIVANWLLIYGRLGAPALGVTGAAWATNLARVYMAGVLLAAIVLHDRRHSTRLAAAAAHVSLARVVRLVRLGLPAALQLTIEVGVFATATALAGRLTPIALAAHQIAMNVIAFLFMVPLGMASAGAVLVGQRVGARDPRGAAGAGWTALLTISATMLAFAVGFLLAPQVLLGAFTHDEGVLALGTTLLAIAAVFQLFDGLQVVATGLLRGVGDTRTPMLLGLVGHWALGLPVGYMLCFPLGLGVIGLWIGLSLGLIVVGFLLVFVWHRRASALVATMGQVVTSAPAS